MKIKMLGAAAVLLASTMAAVPAYAAMTVQYFTVQDNNRDFSGSTAAQGTINNGLQSTLGPNGLPRVTASNPLNAVDFNSSTRELYWWSPGSPNISVTATGTAVINSNTFSDTTFFPTNGNGTSNGGTVGFQTAIFSGSFNLSGTGRSVTFNVNADDDAFLFVDGVSVLQNGGIHGASNVQTSVNLGGGAHTFQLFYADRQETQAALTFSLPDDIVVTPGVPEPSTWAMMVLGFGAVGFAARRRSKVAGRVVTA